MADPGETFGNALARRLASSVTAPPIQPPQDSGVLSAFAARASTDPNAYLHMQAALNRRDQGQEAYTRALMEQQERSHALAQSLMQQGVGAQYGDTVLKNIKDLSSVLGPDVSARLVSEYLNLNPADPSMQNTIRLNQRGQAASLAEQLTQALSRGVQGGTKIEFGDDMMQDAGVVATMPVQEVKNSQITFDEQLGARLDQSNTSIVPTGPRRAIGNAENIETTGEQLTQEGAVGTTGITDPDTQIFSVIKQLMPDASNVRITNGFVMFTATNPKTGLVQSMRIPMSKLAEVLNSSGGL